MLGDCYEANGRWFLNNGFDHKDMVLVHGVAILQTDNKPFGHCWLEDQKYCYDHSNGRNLKFSKRDFYIIGRIPVKGWPLHKYSMKEMNEMLCKYEHWGTWGWMPPR